MEADTNQTVTAPQADAQPNWAAIGLLISVIVTVVIGIALWNNVFAEAWAHYQHPAEGVDVVPKTEALRNLTWSMGTVGAVFAGFIGLVMAGFRTHALYRQAKVAETDSKFSEKKHQAEAFATAIEQLGHDKYPVRLGAVYALEALAKSSKELHGPIFETLCAYVRKEAPAPTDDDLTAKIEARGDDDIREVINDHLKSVAKPDVVVQAILTVVGRRDPIRDPEDFRLDLQGTDLRRATMTKGHFERALLSEAHLERADLLEAHLEGARLDGAHLEGAWLDEAHLEGADLSWAHLEGAGLYEVQCKGANLNGAHLEGAILNKGNLTGAGLFGAHLEDAWLDEAHLEGTDLQVANLKGTLLSRASLKGADLLFVSYNTQTSVYQTDFRKARNIPANPDNNFRATVMGADHAQWPDDDEPGAWDRGEEQA